MTPAFGLGLRRGARITLAFLPNLALYGVAFGVMASGAGLSAAEAAIFSAVAYAGAVQMALMPEWQVPVPLFFVVLTSIALNSRYMLMSATVRPWLARRPAMQAYAALFFLVDANWAMSLREDRDAVDGVGFFLGSGVVMWTGWIAATMAGSALGASLYDPRAFGVDFMVAAFFVVFAVATWGRNRTILPFVVAAGVAVAVERSGIGPWYLLIGALAGSLAGAFARVRSA